MKKENILLILLIPFMLLGAYTIRHYQTDTGQEVKTEVTEPPETLSFDDPFQTDIAELSELDDMLTDPYNDSLNGMSVFDHGDVDYLLNLTNFGGVYQIEVTNFDTGQMWSVNPDSLSVWVLDDNL